MTSRKFMQAMVVAVLMIAGSAFAYGQNQRAKPGDIMFTPVANVEIFIEKVPDGTSRKATTGADGKFSFGTLPPGKYKFVYQKVEGDPTKPAQGAKFNSSKSGVKNYDLQSAKVQVSFEGGASPITREFDGKGEVVIKLTSARELKGVFKGQAKPPAAK